MSLHDGMRRLAGALQAAFIGSDGIEHRLTRGEFRENELQEALRPHLPRRFDLSSGEVVNSSGGHSKQQDVIISDGYLSSPFLVSGRFGVHPIESVWATIQVKSRLTPGEATSATKNLVSVKRLQPDSERPCNSLTDAGVAFESTRAKPFAGVIAFKREGSAEAIARAFLAANKPLDPVDRVNALVVVDDFALCWHNASGRTEVDPLFGQGHLYQADIGDRALLLFYVLLMRWLSTYSPPTLDLLDYFNATAVRHAAFGYPLG